MKFLQCLRPVKTEWWDADVFVCLERGADLHMAQLMPLPLTVSCFSKIQIGFVFLVPADPGSSGQRAAKKGVCVCFFFAVYCRLLNVYFTFIVVKKVKVAHTRLPSIGFRS